MAKLFRSTTSEIRVASNLPLQVRHNYVRKKFYQTPCLPLSGKGVRYPWVKPLAGLWTSSYIEKPEPGEYGDPRPLANLCDWLRWCGSENCMTDRWRYAYVYELTRPARIVEIHTHDDLLALNDEYGVIDDISAQCHAENPRHPLQRYPDWPRIAKAFDAVHLTEAGQWATRMPGFEEDHAFSRDNLYGWDCESTLWLRFPSALRYVRKINLSLGFPRLSRKELREQREIAFFQMKQAMEEMRTLTREATKESVN